MKRLAPLAVLMLLPGLPSSAPAAEKVSLTNLLRQMTDLSLLAEFPDPPYITKQFSSYDRASEAPGSDSWFANADRGFTLYDGVVKEDTPYFRLNPAEMRKPDGTFRAGTRVGFAPTHKPVGEYVWAYATAPDGSAVDGKIPQGYVLKSAITMDPQGHVLADMDGPGCVVRIWSANPDDAGKVRIYLDGTENPVIEAPLKDLLGGKWKTTIDGKEVTPFPDPIACERSRGYNLYFPIAYQKHCKITVEKSDIYYHVDYRTYPQGTEVETFSLAALARAQEESAFVQDRLTGAVTGKFAAKKPWMTFTLKQPIGKGVILEPGQVLNISFEGPGAIRQLQVRVEAPPLREGETFHEAEALRGLVLVGTFDGAEQSQIRCPLGDFFASGPGVNEYGSLPFRVGRITPKEAEFTVWLPMPFQKSAVFEVRNLGKARASVHLHGMNASYDWTDRSMHFHAKWRTATLKTRPFRDWTTCDLKGQGVFVGDMFSLLNPTPAWWGEGDEKIYVDGEKFPSWFGTGSEDYYGYAWSDPRPFQHAYHNQTRCDGPGNKGWDSVNRFHILDAIPFQKSFRFDMEFWHWAPDVEVPLAATCYWYARPGASDDFKEPDAKVLQTLPALPPPYRIEGAIEGEKLKVLGKSSDFEVGPQDMSPFANGKWSGDAHLWVRPPKKGEWVDLELPVAADGKYHVIAYLTKARDYGIVQFALDGKPLGKPIDGYNSPEVVSTGAIDLGEAVLKKSGHTLRVEVVGTNEKSDGLRYMWGLDCVVLKPAAP
jgi:hypothetical protein